jgi:YidC/Oxa1 family membrane protein insertase
MPDQNNRNTIIFVISAVAILILYQIFVLDPQTKQRQADLQRQRAAAAAPAATVPGRTAPTQVSRSTAAAASPRVAVATPALAGSISLRGARIDDLYLRQYRETLDKNSPPVDLLRPEGAQYAWFAEFGWAGANLPGLPNANTLWTQVEGGTLAPNAPVTLRYDNGAGLVFTRRIAVDQSFMFTITDTVANLSGAPVTLAPYGSVQRQGIPEGLGRNQIVHEGGIGWLGDELRQFKYPKWAKEGGEEFNSTGGWVGVTDKSWLASLIPAQGEQVRGQFRITKSGSLNIYEANFTGAPKLIGAGRQVTETTRFFAGAKRAPLLRQYEDTLGVKEFDRAIDWGMFWFLTRPLFNFLDFIFHHVGNFGVAILLLTVVVKAVFFPLANRQYESMTKMKKVQPQMEALRAKHKDDPQKQQQELMALYQREKINPLTGCLPMLLQIPVFYALYKVLTVTIEMRHAPFVGWIQDLSARDPLTMWNLFGLIDWNPATAPLVGHLLDTTLHFGPVAILYVITMWLTTSMNPPAGDPTQQKIMQFMPLMVAFFIAQFAVGLMVYWVWSNLLTILQQYVIMRRFKVENPIDRLIGRVTGKPRTVG